MSDNEALYEHFGDGEKGPSRPTVDLIRDVSREVGVLVRKEIQLARTELAEKARLGALGTGLLSVGGLLAFLTLVLGVAAAVAGIALVLPVWAAALIVSGALCVLAFLFAIAGIRRVARMESPLPEEAIDSTKEDLAWLKTQARSMRP